MAENTQDLWERAAYAAENATHIMSGSVSTPWINRDEFRVELTRAGLAIVDAGKLRRMREALEPLYNRVFNDNGDMTVDMASLTHDETIAGYFAYRALVRAALAPIPTEPAKGETT